MSDSSKDNRTNEQQPSPSIVEWGVRAFSTVAMLALFGFLLYSALQPDIGPNFTLEIHEDEIEQRRNGWAVPFTITNKGTVAISDVLYEMELIDGGSTLVAKRGRISVFGAGESVDGEVWFDSDPRGGNLELRVDTYSL